MSIVDLEARGRSGNVIQVCHSTRNSAVFGGIDAPERFVGYRFALCAGTDNGRFRRGARVGVKGRLVRVRNRARLVLSVEWLAQSVATQMEARDIEPVLDSKSVAANNSGRIS